MSTKKMLWWDFLKLIPIILFIGIMPLLVRVKTVIMPELGVEWLPTPFIYNDVFNYYKSRLILLSAMLAIIFLLGGWVIGRVSFKITSVDKLIVAFGISVVVSSILSEHKEVVYWGYAERWHGALTWLSYIVMYFYMKWILTSKEEKRVVLRMILFFGIIMTGIGVLQFLSLDPFRTELFKRLIVSKQMIEKVGLNSISFTFELNRVYMTLYNPNNVGLYTSTALPLCIVGYRLEISKCYKALWCIFASLLMICLVGSYSRTGLIALAISFVVYALINTRSVKKYYKQIVAIMIVLGVITIAVDINSDSIFLHRLKTTFGTRPLYTRVINISTDNSILKIDYDSKIVRFKHDASNRKLEIFGENGDEMVVFQDDSGYFIFDEKSLNGLKYGVGKTNEDKYYIAINAQKKEWRFLVSDDGFKFINSYGNAVDIIDAPSLLFNGRERLGSNRGYIWSRSLPLLKKNVLFGSGPDSYTLEFPQNDYVMKMNVFGDTNKIVDKPHNQYIGWMTNFGIVGFVLIVSWLMISWFKSRNMLESISLLCLLVSLFFYDISVGTGWILITVIGLMEWKMVECKEKQIPKR